MRILVIAALSIIAMSVFTPLSAATAANWPEYKADGVEYFQNKLPSPVVIYIYTADGNLSSVIESNKSIDRNYIKEVGVLLADKDFPKIDESRRKLLAKSMNSFLNDQGYRLDQIVNGKTKFTLVLTMFTVKDTDCVKYKQIYKEYGAVIQKAIQPQVGQSPEYSVAVLRLQSPLVHLECKK